MKITLKELECLVATKHYPKIKTPSGYESITDTYRKSSEGVHLIFDDNTEIKASVLHLVNYKSNWVYIDSFNEGDSINDKLIIKKISLSEQTWIDFTINAKHESYYHCGILHHNSGKSMVLGVICRYQTEALEGKTLIVVPTVGLTTQMKGDFVDYFQHTGWSGDDNIQLISAGADKKITKPITISTFQSIYKFDADWFNQFNCIIADEGHKVTAATIGGIFNKATKVKYKIACTGTIHDVKCNLLNMIGLTGPVHDIALTKDLIKNKQLVPLSIKALTLNYPADICKAMKKVDYDAEIKYIVTNDKRNSFIAKLAVACKGTTLVLYRFVDLQGQLLYNKILGRVTDRPVYFIDGSVKGSEREMMRLSANKMSDVVIEFENLILTCEYDATIPLINSNEYKLASNITVDDDIDIEKIINNNLITGVNIRWKTI